MTYTNYTINVYKASETEPRRISYYDDVADARRSFFMYLSLLQDVEPETKYVVEWVRNHHTENGDVKREVIAAEETLPI